MSLDTRLVYYHGVHDPDLTEHIQAFERYLQALDKPLSDADYEALRRLYDELVAMLKERTDGG